MSCDVSVVWCRVSVRFHPGAALLISHLLKSVGIATTWPGSTRAFPALPSGLLRVYKCKAPAFPRIFYFIVKTQTLNSVRFDLLATLLSAISSAVFPPLPRGGTPHAVKTTSLYCK